MQQAYVFAHGVDTLGVTTTVNGLSTKHVLVGLRSGQIASISRQFLDTRRPAKEVMTAEYWEEGLVPYHHTIIENKYNIINYYRKVVKKWEMHIDFFR
jgi:hypothetical protein